MVAPELHVARYLLLGQSRSFQWYQFAPRLAPQKDTPPVALHSHQAINPEPRSDKISTAHALDPPSSSTQTDHHHHQPNPSPNPAHAERPSLPPPPFSCHPHNAASRFRGTGRLIRGHPSLDLQRHTSILSPHLFYGSSVPSPYHSASAPIRPLLPHVRLRRRLIPARARGLHREGLRRPRGHTGRSAKRKPAGHRGGGYVGIVTER